MLITHFYGESRENDITRAMNKKENEGHSKSNEYSYP
jgi:hypothetical protein